MTQRKTPRQTRCRSPVSQVSADPPQNPIATGATLVAMKQSLGVDAVSADASRIRRRVDWHSIERDFRTGTFTLRELGQRHGRSAAQISRQARARGWSKDLREVVRQATSTALIRELSSQKATAAQNETTETVLVAARAVTEVVLGHRRDIARAQGLFSDLLAELAVTTHQTQGLLRHLDAGALDGVDHAQLIDGLRQLVQLPTRAAILQRLVDALAKLQQLERRAFGLDEVNGAGDGDTPLSDIERAARLVSILERARQARDRSERAVLLTELCPG